MNTAICPDCGRLITLVEEKNVCRFCGYLYVDTSTEKKRRRLPDFQRYRMLLEHLGLAAGEIQPFEDSGSFPGVAEFVKSDDMNSRLYLLDCGKRRFQSLCRYVESMDCLTLTNMGDGQSDSLEGLLLYFSKQLESITENVYREFTGIIKTPEYIDYAFTLGMPGMYEGGFFEPVFTAFCDLVNLLAKRIRIVIVIADANQFIDKNPDVFDLLLRACPYNVRILSVTGAHQPHLDRDSEYMSWFKKYRRVNIPMELTVTCRTQARVMKHRDYCVFEYELIRFITSQFSDGNEDSHNFIKAAAIWSIKNNVPTFTSALSKISPKCVKNAEAFSRMIYDLFEHTPPDRRESPTVLLNLNGYLLKHHDVFYDKDKKTAALKRYSEALNSPIERNAPYLIRRIFFDTYCAKFYKKMSVPHTLSDTIFRIKNHYYASASENAEYFIALREAILNALNTYQSIYEDIRAKEGYLASFDELDTLNAFLTLCAEQSETLMYPLLKAKSLLTYAKYNYDISKCLECLNICKQKQHTQNPEYWLIIAKCCDFMFNSYFADEANIPLIQQNIMDATFSIMRKAASDLFRLYPCRHILDDRGGAFHLSCLINKRSFYMYTQENLSGAIGMFGKCVDFIEYIGGKPFSEPARKNYQAFYECKLIMGVAELKAGEFANAEKIFYELENILVTEVGIETEYSIIWLSNLYFYFKRLYEQYNGDAYHSFYKFRDVKLTNRMVAVIRYALLNSRLVLCYGHTDIAVYTYDALKQITAHFKDNEDDYYNNYKNICYGYLTICRENEFIQRVPAIAEAIARRCNESLGEDFEFYLNLEYLPFGEPYVKALMDHLLSKDFFE